MNRIKALAIALTLMTGLVPALAQDNLTVELKSGSELTGYISQQRPGQSFTFSSSKALVVLPKSDVQSIIDNPISISALSAEWVKWAEANDAFTGIGNERTLVLSNIVTRNGTINQVRVLERGAKIRYLDLQSRTHSLKWDTIQVIRGEKRPKLLLSGVNRRYKLASGMEYEGQYVEEVPGKTLSLMMDNGVVEVFNTMDVVKDMRIKVNPNQSLLEQSDLIDVVQTTGGATYRGVIFERNYFANEQAGKDFLLIEMENGNMQSLTMSEVTEYRKERNPNYKPLTDIVLEEGQAAINRVVGKITKVEEKAGHMIVKDDTVSISVPSQNPQAITAEFKMSNAEAQQLKIVPITKYEEKKTKAVVYGFTFEDIVKRAVIPGAVATSINGISKVEFTLPNGSNGRYGVYNPVANTILLFEIH